MHRTRTTSLAPPRIGRDRAWPESGFTLIEILIVMAIIGFLAGLVLFAAGSITKGAKDKRTIALADRIQTFLSDYYRKAGELPPDGLDTKVEIDGVRVESSAALWHALSNPVVQSFEVAGEEKVRELEPVAAFESGDLAEDGEHPGIFHIIDGFGKRLHYDNLKKRRNPPEASDSDELKLDESDDHGRWRDEHLGYELWSLGMRTAQAEAGVED